MADSGRNNADIVRDTIYKACLFQDDEQWEEWLDLCDDSFEYAIKAFSPEIQYDMTYLSGNKTYMQAMTRMLPKHNTDHSPLKRHCVVYEVIVDGETATATSSVLVYQTLLDGTNAHVDAGETRLFVAGRYVDSFKLADGKAKFTSRVTQLDTRRLDKGSHWPL
ncbi:MAG: methanesulfonate monooxygenase small subunit [Parasphingorhabdus sp.]|jgi:methanesulfonate monooxygenase small subunit